MVLTIFRNNRAEFLVDLLASQLRSSPPDPLQPVQVVVNTWPTSRWLGEQLALRLGGIAAHLRFPFPASHLAMVVDALLEDTSAGGDPWRASRLVWPVLELLPAVAAQDPGGPLGRWLGPASPGAPLDARTWQLGRAIADAFDDYALYRPELLAGWERSQPVDGGGRPLPPEQQWQMSLYGALRQRLDREPFALRVDRAIGRLQHSRTLPEPLEKQLGGALRLFGLSSLAPVQVRLLQALSGSLPVDLYLLTPCDDLWQRCRERRRQLRDALALRHPLEGEWLRTAPGLEARFGRLGAEFQQLLEGTGEAQLGSSQERNFFFLPASVASGRSGHPPPLLHQLQEQLVTPSAWPDLTLAPGDHSLEFHACPGPLRQVQIVRDRLLQLLAEHPDLEARDILVMTPEVEACAPLVASVFGDSDATGVSLPWRITDRSQQSQAGAASTVLQLLLLAGDRLTASGLDTLLGCLPLQRRFDLEGGEIVRLNRELQRLGFRWGLDGRERGGDPTHTLSWAMDRLLLSLVLPPTPGLALGSPGPAAPAEAPLPLELVGRWLHLLRRLRHWLQQLALPHSVADWGELLRELIADLFGEGVETAGELSALLAALEEGLSQAASFPDALEAPVVAAMLTEALSADSGRFGHRSGALTISALEPMRAIPHRVIVLMGLDAHCFPRRRERPGFHLMGQGRHLGDADAADQDRYILLEALLSARQHLLITWSCRDERTGEGLPPAPPVRHWLEWLHGGLGTAADQLLVPHPASPLERSNFLPQGCRPPASCDRRLLEARQALDHGRLQPPRGLAFAALPPPQPLPQATPAEGEGVGAITCGDLRDWLMHPQRHWLSRLGMHPREWQDRCADLEAMELEERDRSALLRQVLRQGEQGGPPAPAAASDWLERQRGRGLLPPLGGGLLEAEALHRRWLSLSAALEELGDPWIQEVFWRGWQGNLQGRGSALVRVHCGRESPGERLALWLDLLLVCAGAEVGHSPAQRGILISRGEGDQFAVTTRLRAPEPEAAAGELERLAALALEWQDRCWPVPPRTGWAWLEAERRQPGSGAPAARQVWEGGAQLAGEQRQEEMALCFGSRLSLEELLSAPFQSCVTTLLEPLLEAIEARPSRRGSRRP